MFHIRQADTELSSDPEHNNPFMSHLTDVIYLELACHQHITLSFFKSSSTIYKIIIFLKIPVLKVYILKYTVKKKRKKPAAPHVSLARLLLVMGGFWAFICIPQAVSNVSE